MSLVSMNKSQSMVVMNKFSSSEYTYANGLQVTCVTLPNQREPTRNNCSLHISYVPCFLEKNIQELTWKPMILLMLYIQTFKE